MEIFNLNDKVIKINIGGYLVPRLYAAAVVINEIIYKLLSELFKELFIRLQRENIFI